MIRRRTFNQSILAALLQLGLGIRVAGAAPAPTVASSLALTADSKRLISDIV